MAIIHKLSEEQLKMLHKGARTSSPVTLDKIVREAARLAEHYKDDEESPHFNYAAGRCYFEMYHLLMYGRKPNAQKAELMLIKSLGYFMNAQSDDFPDGFLGVLDVALNVRNSLGLKHKGDIEGVINENIKKCSDAYHKALDSKRNDIGEKDFFFYKGLIYDICGKAKECSECYNQALAK